MIKFKAITPKKGVLEKQAWKALGKQTLQWAEDKVKDVECPIHQGRPKITVSSSGKNLQFDIKGCCPDLERRAKEVLKAALQQKTVQ